MIAKFYKKQQPEIRPSYWKTNESSFIIKNLTEKNQQFLLQRKLIEDKKDKESQQSNSNDVTVKITSQVFTESFYNGIYCKSPKLNISKQSCCRLFSQLFRLFEHWEVDE